MVESDIPSPEVSGKLPFEIFSDRPDRVASGTFDRAFGRADATIIATLTERAYAAGLFDGEGNITIAKNYNVKGARSAVYNMRIGVSQNDVEPLYWLRDRWGGSVNAMSRRTANRNVTHYWQCFARRAERFLIDVQPFLQVKAERAAIALLFQSTLFNPGVRGHTAAYRVRHEELRRQMAALNGHKKKLEILGQKVRAKEALFVDAGEQAA